VSEWRLSVATSTERTLSRLPERIAAAVVEFMVGPLVETPIVVGKPLEGYWSARRGAYRVIYRLDEDEGLVVVVRIEHRGDVFRSR
jgi:mRNA interferase RelE/StbE